MTTHNLPNDCHVEILVSPDGESCRYFLYQYGHLRFTEVTASAEFALQYARERARAFKPSTRRRALGAARV